MRLCTIRKIRRYVTEKCRQHVGHSFAKSQSLRYYSTNIALYEACKNKRDAAKKSNSRQRRKIIEFNAQTIHKPPPPRLRYKFKCSISSIYGTTGTYSSCRKYRWPKRMCPCCEKSDDLRPAVNREPGYRRGDSPSSDT